MGGRGASSGISEGGKRYGTQYHTVRDKDGKPIVYGNVMFVKRNPEAKEQLLETMTRGRVYAEIGQVNELRRLHYYDNDLMRTKRVDPDTHEGIKPHTQHGYYGTEEPAKAGAAHTTPQERELLERVQRFWDDYNAGRST